MTPPRQLIRPQPGFQTSFLASRADIVIGGGAAGAGKSYALLMEPLRHAGNPGFRAAIFRRTTVQVKNSGGLWDTSKEIYLKLRNESGQQPTPTEAPPKWKFPSGATLLFSHLEHEQTKYDWDGAQIAFLGFDELIHFTPGQFWYLVGRNRSACGVKPYIRATTNPQTSGWVKRLISWWIYPDDHEAEHLRGMPIPERAGVVRYLARWNEASYWGQSPKGAMEQLPQEGREAYRPELVKSITFIPGTLDDNRELTDKDLGYKGNLLAQDKRHGSRLLRGCWYDAEKENELFAFEDLQDLFTNTFVVKNDESSGWYMTADIAMEGADCLRIGIWDGLCLYKVFSWAKSDGRFIWEEMTRLAHTYNIPGRNIVFDANGVGNFLTGFFKSSHDFRSQHTPLEEKPAEGGGDKIKVDYKDLRTQCAFWLSRYVAKKKLFFDIPDDRQRDAIIEEFEAHKKTGQNATGKLTITPKEEIKALLRRSPDYFDMILMRMVFEIVPQKQSWLTTPKPAGYDD